MVRTISARRLREIETEANDGLWGAEGAVGRLLSDGWTDEADEVRAMITEIRRLRESKGPRTLWAVYEGDHLYVCETTYSKARTTKKHLERFHAIQKAEGYQVTVVRFEEVRGKRR